MYAHSEPTMLLLWSESEIIKATNCSTSTGTWLDRPRKPQQSCRVRQVRGIGFQRRGNMWGRKERKLKAGANWNFGLYLRDWNSIQTLGQSHNWFWSQMTIQVMAYLVIRRCLNKYRHHLNSEQRYSLFRTKHTCFVLQSHKLAWVVLTGSLYSRLPTYRYEVSGWLGC